MKKITRDQVVFAMDKKNTPVLTVDAGEKIFVETEDCFSHQIVKDSDVLNDDFDYSRVNPATGPIALNDCQPGDILAVTIEKITLDSQGAVELYPGWGPLGSRVEKAVTKIVPIADGMVKFNNISLPVRPMIGVIGVAPEGEGVPCGSPGYHGGNMDTVDIVQGSKIYFPVFVSGANLSLGDVHAVMGDGEVCGTGVEIRAEIIIKIDVIKNKCLTHPVLESKDNYYLINSADTLEEAIRFNTEKVVQFIQEQSMVSWSEAYMLASIATDLKISQVVNPLKTVRTRIPKRIIKELWPQ